MSDSAKVCELISLGIQGPLFMPQRELLSKSYAERLKVTNASNLVTEVEEELHLLDGHYKSRELMLC